MRHLLTFVVGAAVTLIMVAAAPAAGGLTLTVVAQDSGTITLGWAPPAGANSYTFWVAGARVSNTQDGGRSSVRFAKAPCNPDPGCYEVRANTALASGTYPAPVTPPPPPPPPPSTITPAQFQQQAVAGATIQNVTVTGSVSVNVANLTVTGTTIQGTLNLGANAQHFTFDHGQMVDFVAHGSDYVAITNSVLDGGPGKSCQNFIWPANQDPSTHWTLTGNTFRNYQCENPHSEALYIASGAAYGLIDGNTFTNNGSTSHVFWTWCNDSGNNCVAYGQGNTAPHDWALRNNTFYDTWRAYYAVSLREELTQNGKGPVAGLNICVDSHQTVTGPIIQPPDYGGRLAEFLVPWGTLLLKTSCSDPR